MKIQMERYYPVLKDVGQQSAEHPELNYCFMYDDGSIYRAVLCDEIRAGERVVTALRKNSVICQLPADSSWRLVHLDILEFLTGEQMEEIELRGMKVKKDFTERMVEELKLDDSKTPTEYTKTGYNPKLYH